jgi:GNAT superfamily N-acetyltransferase
MQIFEFGGTAEQSLLCLRYDFSEDCKSDREVAVHAFGRGVDLKSRWYEDHRFKGLRLLLAFEGSTPVGQIEFIPIEHAPQPVSGEALMFVDCLFVTPQSRGRGIGTQLLLAAEAKARERAKKGLAVIAYPSANRMPVSFFVERDFSPVAEADGRYLLTKTWAEVRPPEFIPRRYQPSPADQPGRVVVDYFWSAQCPCAVRTRDLLMQVAHSMSDEVVVHEVNTDQRATLEQFGVTQECFINGRRAFVDPPSRSQIKNTLEEALQRA